MQRVKRSTAVATRPAMPAGGTPGYFASPNPGGGVPATIPGFEWFNSVQEELCAVIAAAGIALDIANTGQLLAAIIKLGKTGALFGVTPAADKLIYATGADTFAITTLTAFARSLLDDANAATACTTLGAAPLASPAFSGAPTAPNPATGTRSTAVATMQKFADEFGCSLAASGYQKLSSGLIIQWGAVTVGNIGVTADETIIFPITFPTACLRAFTSLEGTDAYGILEHVKSKSPSSVVCRRTEIGGYAQSADSAIAFFAIGY